MKNIAIIFWSGTGNTQQMAEAIGAGATTDATAVKVIPVDQASQANLAEADAVALGCPSMGSEVLEEMEMEPFVAAIAPEALAGKPLALFGSYDWGDGQWMRDWEERMAATSAKLIDGGLTIRSTPDADGLEQCKALGAKLAAAL